MRKMLLGLGLVAAVLAACTSSDRVVAEVDGDSITLADVQALFAGDIVPATEFRGGLTALIQRDVLLRAGAEQLEMALNPNDIQSEIEDVEAAFAATGQDLDEALAATGTTREVVRLRAELTLLQLGAVEALELQGLDLQTWIRRELEAADVRVDERYGEWRTNPDPRVYPPPG